MTYDKLVRKQNHLKDSQTVCEQDDIKQVENPQSKYELILELATSGDRQAQYELASIFDKGIIKDRSDNVAYHWYRKAAERGDAKACRKIAMFYEKGRAVDIDIQKAINWYEAAVKNGDIGSKRDIERLTH